MPKHSTNAYRPPLWAPFPHPPRTNAPPAAAPGAGSWSTTVCCLRGASATSSRPSLPCPPASSRGPAGTPRDTFRAKYTPAPPCPGGAAPAVRARSPVLSFPKPVFPLSLVSQFSHYPSFLSFPMIPLFSDFPSSSFPRLPILISPFPFLFPPQVLNRAFLCDPPAGAPPAERALCLGGGAGDAGLLGYDLMRTAAALNCTCR